MRTSDNDTALYCTRQTFLALLIVATCADLAAGGAPMVMIKLDDVVAVTPQWQRVVDFLTKEGLKANFGVIGSALEKEDPALIAWVGKLKAAGTIEFWNHGYAGFGHPKEFEGTGYEAQLRALKRTQELGKLRFGAAFTAFGPHSSGADADTFRALAELPEITLVWQYGPPKGTSVPAFRAFVVERRMNLEKPIFVPNPQFVQEQFEKDGKTRDYISLQGHPAAWDDAKFADFQKAMLYLKGQGCRFVLASEFLATRKR
jgi:peptidoglycan/xylan/chitin deacetylase (PgdA/CDA1 family)